MLCLISENLRRNGMEINEEGAWCISREYSGDSVGILS